MIARLFFIGLFSALPFYGFAQQTIFVPMKNAIKAGDVDELGNYLNKTIELNMEGEANTYSKVKAKNALLDFFEKHSPTDFTIVHTGSSKGGLKFAIGKYQSGGDTYNVLMRVRQIEKKYLIHEMSFTKE